MITRVEATRYRCFTRLGVDVGGFRVLIGANGSGKTTLIDIPLLIGELLKATNVAAPFLERRPEAAPRATALDELVYAQRGNDFSLAVEARLPSDVQARVLEGMLARTKSSNTERALREDSSRWPTHIRYEIALRITDGRELQVVGEYAFLFPEARHPDRDLAGLHGPTAENVSSWRLILWREFGYEARIMTESPPAGARKISHTKVGLPNVMLALQRVLYESEAEFPAARYLLRLLTEGAVFLDPDWNGMRFASPPGLPKTITPSARNLPWLALDLKRDGTRSNSPKTYRSERYQDWVAHVKTALPKLIDIDVIEREDDHHAYFKVSYKDDFSVPSSGLSDGTLRILTLTILPYLTSPPSILVTEEPENGIHPRAIEAVLQSLSSMYDSQVWVSSHSPVVVAMTDVEKLVCARLSSHSGVEMVPGPEHPRLVEWKGGVDLGTLFAAGVLG